MNNLAVISVAVAPIHRDPDFSSEMVTQELLWERVKIIGSKNNWHQIQTQDGYLGWIHSFYICDVNVPNNDFMKITDRFVPIFSNLNEPDSIVMILSFATNVHVIKKLNDFIKIQLPDGTHAFMENQRKVFENNRQNLIKCSKTLLGVPYLWGGTSSFGYDCSGFVQAVLKVMGLSIKRDTSQQIKHKGLKEIDLLDGKPGDLIFFSKNNKINHVAFFIGDGKIIHCSGQVKIESIKGDHMDANKDLCQYDKRIMSISKLIDDNVDIS